MEAGAGQRLFGDTGSAEAERPRLSRCGRWQLGAAPDDTDGNGEERIAVGGGVDRNGLDPELRREVEELLSADVASHGILASSNLPSGGAGSTSTISVPQRSL